MKLKRIPALLMVLVLCVSFLQAPVLATEPIVKTLTLTEDWRLTSDLDLNVPKDTTLRIDGEDKYHIYEMGGTLLNNGAGNVIIAEKTYVYTAGGRPPIPISIKTAELPAARVGNAYSQVIAFAKNYTVDGAVAFSATGLPEGLSIDGESGVISGTPASGADADSPYSVVVKAQVNPDTYDTETYSLMVNSAPPAGGGSVPAPAPSPVTDGDFTTVTKEVKPTTTGTTASAAVSEADMTKLIDAVMKAASESGTAANVNLVVDAPTNAARVSTTIPTASLTDLADADAPASLTVTTPVGAVTFDNDALAGIGGAAAGTSVTVTIAEVPKEELTPAQQVLVGDRPVIDLSLTSGGKEISDFGGGSASVSIPYTLAEGEDPDNLVVWFLADDGTLTPIKCSYRDGSLIFVTDHFSEYVLAYFPFSDLNGGEWFYENVAYAYTNGLMSGVGNDLFDPSGSTTRGMVVTILWRLEGKPAAEDCGFTDVSAGLWYSDAVNWAAENGIVEGYDGKFAPEDAITREQMAAILYRYAAYKGYDTSKLSDLSSFTDAVQVSDWAGTAMKWVVQAGIIGGSNNKLDPLGNAQRAQVAAIFQRFIENITK